MALTKAEMELISLLIGIAIREAYSYIENATEEEIKERILLERKRKEGLMKRIE